MNKRAGPWSEDEKLYIAENCEHLNYQEIADYLGRNREKVKKYIRDTLGKPVTSSIEYNTEYSLKKSPIWRELCIQFTKEELKMFVYHWQRIITQFKDDVLPTEEMQVIDYIRLEILISRLLIQQQKNAEEVESLETILSNERRKPLDQQNIILIQNTSDQIALRRSAQQAISKDHLELTKNKTTILDKMKGTREARIKMLESSKETMLGWIKNIITDGPTRQKLGIQMEKMRLAMKQEEARLRKYHKYHDGSIDIPFLSGKDYEPEQDDESDNQEDLANTTQVCKTE